MPRVTNKKSLSKEEEIRILQSLKCDSYFHQFFSSSDIDQMCENIRNDFAIENGCAFMLNSNFYERQFDALCQDIITQLPPYGTPEDIYDVIVMRWGLRNIILYKHEKELPLTQNEIDYLIANLN